MISGRPTHAFPRGRPRPLIALEVATVVGWVALVIYPLPLVLSVTLRWILGLPLFAGLMFAYSSMITHYERTGRAVKLPNLRTWTKYDRLPKPVIAVRTSFFVVVAAMFLSGFLPIHQDTARKGIIACVLMLMGIGILSVVLERHYVNTGRAEDIRVDREQP